MRKLVSDLNNSSEIIIGDAKQELQKIKSEQFQCCVTSPPYWGLRDYNISGQIGAESNLNDYILNLVEIFSEVKRVLRNDGSLWLNIGDAYTSGGRTWRDADKKNKGRGMSYRPATPDGLKPKDLIGLPWRLAFALQQDGWHLRSDIIWHKPNCQPESVKDRPTQSHEYIFLLTKEEKYYYDYQAIMEKTKDGKSKKNRRTVWSIPTQPFKEAHFAVFPPALITPCVQAGSFEHSWVLDPFFGSGTVGEVCRNLNRNFLGIELNPEYCEIAKKRLQLSLAKAS